MSIDRTYTTWATNKVIPLQLILQSTSGAGVTGASPEVSIRRFKETKTDVLLDNFFWNGTSFQMGEFFFTLTQVDPVSSPGLYQYQFRNDFIGIEQIYHAYYRHTVSPIGFAVETHVISNEVFVPDVLPDPIVIGATSIMGQLELIKDGGDGDYDITADSLHDLSSSLGRVLGLQHDNAIVDNHIYDAQGQLTSARLRVFDTVANLPVTPGGSETTGLIFEYTFTATYVGQNLQTMWLGQRVL